MRYYFRTVDGRHTIDGVEHPIGPQQLHFLFPGQQHHWETGKETQLQRVTVGRRLFESFSSSEVFHLIRFNPQPVFKLDESAFRTVSGELQAIQKHLGEADYRSAAWQTVLSVRMDILALLISREAEVYVKETILERTRPVVRDFWLLLNLNYFGKKTVSWYAAQLGVTPNYLNLLCKKDLNITAKQLIGWRILLEAKNSLRFSDKTIKEITYELGFSDISSFSNYFKRNSGFWPREYRA